MKDPKYFTKGKVVELRQELALDRRDKNHKTKKNALKRVVANMTMSNNEMVGLFPDVMACMSINDLEIKKMCFLYLLTYARARPVIAAQALNVLLEDVRDHSPLIRALALRTLSSIPLPAFIQEAISVTPDLLDDNDAYVRKTAAFAVAKLWSTPEQAQVEKVGLVSALNSMLADLNATVVASALAALADIAAKSQDRLELTVDRQNAFNIASIMPDVNEWCQIYILNGLMNFVPQTSAEALTIIDRTLPRLQHANASVVLASIRLILYLSNYVTNLEREVPTLPQRIGPALITLLSKPAEIQYLALRNCILLLQSRPQLVQLDVRVFFCKYNDPIYIKSTKLEIIFLLANERNIGVVLDEFRECATEIDVQIVRKAVRAIGKMAVKVEKASDACIEAILELVATKVSYIVQEAMVVMQYIFRRYPNRYESVISVLCDNLDSLDEPEAKSAMIWIIGHYADRIDNAAMLLDGFLLSFASEPPEVQLSLLTATIKLFILRPTKGQALVPTVLKAATEECDNPDVRDRGFMYWRLLSSDPQAAKKIVGGVFPTISADSDRMDDDKLEELELAIGTLATIYLKPIRQLFRHAPVRTLKPSPALAPRHSHPGSVPSSYHKDESRALHSVMQDRLQLGPSSPLVLDDDDEDPHLQSHRGNHQPSPQKHFYNGSNRNRNDHSNNQSAMLIDLDDEVTHSANSPRNGVSYMSEERDLLS